ncbi:MAG TPA: signal peptidase I [Chloroflexia bacterium]|nr:signal peptidase I [Chloroflexia bacterium]
MEAMSVTGTAVSSSETVEAAEAGETRTAGTFTSSRLGKLATRLVTTLGMALAVGVVALTIGPRFLPYQTYTVLSGSMEPTLPVGSVIVAVPAKGDALHTGDIITVANPQHAGALVTHRIIAIDNSPQGRTFQTKGDANNVADSWVVPGTGSGWRYAFAIPYLGYALSTLQSDIGRLLLLVIPTFLLAGLMLLEIWLPARKPEQAPDAALTAGA